MFIPKANLFVGKEKSLDALDETTGSENTSWVDSSRCDSSRLHRGAVCGEQVLREVTDLCLMPAPIPLSLHPRLALSAPAHVIHLRQAQRYLVKASINGQSTALLIDSGSTKATLPSANAKKMGLMGLVRGYRLREVKVALLRPVTVVLDGAVEAVVEFSVMPEDFGCFHIGLLPNTILTEFGCYYQFHPNGDASLNFRRLRTPGLKHGETLYHTVYFLQCVDQARGATKNVLVDSGAIHNFAGPELMAGAHRLNVKLFQTAGQQLCLEQVRLKPLGPIHMIAGTIFMTQYRAIVDFGTLQAFFYLGGRYYVVPVVESGPSYPSISN